MMALRSFRIVLAFVAGLALASSGFAQHQHGDRRTEEWNPDVVHRMRGLPVQESGRIKPFDTFAQFLMLRINEHRGKHVPDDPARFGELAGTILGPTEWAMDVLLYPDQADDYPVFVVTDAEALQRIGLGEIARKKRDRYSFQELQPGLAQLDTLWEEYRRIEERDRDRLQNQIVYLAHDLMDYQGLKHAFDAARARFPIGDSPTLSRIFEGAPSVRYSEALSQIGEVLTAYRRMVGTGDEPLDEAAKQDVESIHRFLGQLESVSRSSRSLIWLPPSDQREEAWLDLSGVFAEIADSGPARHRSQIVALQMLERVVDATEFGPEAVGNAILPWVDHVREMAFSRGEAGKVDSEVTYYELGPIDKAFYGYILALLFAVIVWLRPRWRVPYVATWGLCGLASLSLVGGIAYRCFLLGRPPVLNLYDTILFITATATIVGMVVEAIHRGRIALTVGTVLGVAGLFLAGRFETIDGTDTMRQLQAVLDTNFWLATHVTTVTLGYSAGLLAGALAHVYILGRLFGLSRSNPAFYRDVAKMVYGVLCFGVLLSTVGTILGGIWANYSWGRFWGWDPKENGALMIVLFELGVLHARLAGFIRNWGMCILAVIGNMVVAFSWWHVNNMGVGLHSYGFTSGIVRTLWIFYGIETFVVALGVLGWWVQRQVAKRAEELAGSPGHGDVQQQTS